MPTADVPTFFAAIDAGDAAGVAAALGADPALAAARDGDGVSATMHALYHGRRDLADTIAAALLELDVFEAAALVGSTGWRRSWWRSPRLPPPARPTGSRPSITRRSSGGGCGGRKPSASRRRRTRQCAIGQRPVGPAIHSATAGKPRRRRRGPDRCWRRRQRDPTTRLDAAPRSCAERIAAVRRAALGGGRRSGGAQ